MKSVRTILSKICVCFVRWIPCFWITFYLNNGYSETIAFQFLASHYFKTAPIWTSNHPNGTLVPVHPETNGWTHAELNDDGICFDITTAPFEFNSTTSLSIASLFAVASFPSAEWHSTLIDAPCSIRVEPISPFLDAWHFVESQLDETLQIQINDIPTTRLQISESWMLIKVAFDRPCPSEELFIGGPPTTPAWNQNWQGKLAELIFLTDEPTEEQSEAIRRYLSVKYQLPIRTRPTPQILETLSALSIDTSGLFQSLLFVQ